METRPHRPKRSIRHAEAAAQHPRPSPSAQHHGRAERERRRQLYTLAIIGAIILVAFLIPAYGYWREVIRLSDSPIVTIDGHRYSVEEYARYIGTRQGLISRQIQQIQATVPTPVPAATPSPSAATTPTSPSIQAQINIQILQSRQANLLTTGLSELVEANLVTAEANKRGLTASRAELDDALRWLMSPPNEAINQGFGLDTLPSPLPTTGLISLDEAKKDLHAIDANQRFLDDAQVDELILKPIVLKTKLETVLSASLATAGEQVHARHILVDSEDTAKEIRQKLENGADFAALAKEYSTDTSNKDQGGDLGWFGKGMMVPEFEQAAFSLKVGEISEPVHTQFGYHLIQVLEKDPNRPYDPARLSQLRAEEYAKWLGPLQADPDRVSYDTSTAKTTWIRQYVGGG